MRESGPLPAVLGAVGEPVYRVVVRTRNRSFDRGRRVTKLPIPVISVGNLSVGGTGKTPFVAMLVERLRGAGLDVAIAMRGYRAGAGGESDEAGEYRDRFGDDVPLVIGADRIAGIRALLSRRPALGCVVLDDGFQHRFVARDLDIVLLDATRDPLRDHCLPRGWLREPPASLARAGLVVLTRADSVSPESIERLEDGVRRRTNAPIAHAAHQWDGFDVGNEAVGASWLQNRRVVVACAIGNPMAFIEQAERAGGIVTGRITERDHHAWTRADLERIRAQVVRTDAGGVLTTGKDWVKLRAIDGGIDSIGVPVGRARVRMGILKGRDELERRVLAVAGPGGG